MATPTNSNVTTATTGGTTPVALAAMNLASAGRIYVACASGMNMNLPGAPTVTYSYNAGANTGTLTLLEEVVECPSMQQSILTTTMLGGALRIYYWDTPPTGTNITITVTPYNQVSDAAENNGSSHTVVAWAVHGTNAGGPIDWLIKFHDQMWDLSPNGAGTATTTSWSTSVNALSSTDLIMSAFVTMAASASHTATTGAVIGAGAGTASHSTGAGGSHTLTVSSLAASGAGSTAMTFGSAAAHFAFQLTMVFRDSGAAAVDFLRVNTPRDHYNHQETNIRFEGPFTEATAGNFDDIQIKRTHPTTGAIIQDWTEVTHSKPGGTWRVDLPNPGHSSGFNVQFRFRNSSNVVVATSLIPWHPVGVGLTGATWGSSSMDYQFTQGSSQITRQMRRKNARRYAPFIGAVGQMRGPPAIALCNALLDQAAAAGTTDTSILLIDAGDDGTGSGDWNSISDPGWVRVTDGIAANGGEIDFFYGHNVTNDIRTGSSATSAFADTKAEIEVLLGDNWDVVLDNFPGVPSYWLDAQQAPSETYTAGAPRDRYIWSIFREVGREGAATRTELAVVQVPIDLSVSADSTHVNVLPDGRWSGLRAGRAIGADLFGLPMALLGPDLAGWTRIDSTHALAHFEPDPASEATGLTTRKRGTAGATGFTISIDEGMATLISPDNYNAAIITPWDVLLTFTGGQTIAATDYIRYAQGSGTQTVSAVTVNIPDMTNALYDDTDVGDQVKVIAYGHDTASQASSTIGISLADLTLVDAGVPIATDDILIIWMQYEKNNNPSSNPTGTIQIGSGPGANPSGTAGSRVNWARLLPSHIASPSTDFTYSGLSTATRTKESLIVATVLRLPTGVTLKSGSTEVAPADGDLDGTTFTRNSGGVGLYAFVIATADTTTITPPSSDWDVITAPQTVAGDWTFGQWILTPELRYTSGAAYAFGGINSSAGAACLAVLELTL